MFDFADGAGEVEIRPLQTAYFRHIHVCQHREKSDLPFWITHRRQQLLHLLKAQRMRRAAAHCRQLHESGRILRQIKSGSDRMREDRADDVTNVSSCLDRVPVDQGCGDKALDYFVGYLR